MNNILKILILMTLILPMQANALPSKQSKHALEWLNKWHDEMTAKDLISHDLMFDKKYSEFKEVHTWFGIEEDELEEKDRFFKFASDADGAMYYLWFILV